MENSQGNNEASSGTSVLDAGLERLRVAAGIELEDSFEAGSKWCVGDDELAALVALAKEEERAECANWLRRNANAEKDPVKRATFIEAHNAILVRSNGGELCATPESRREGTK